jgi:hypothetical protein
MMMPIAIRIPAEPPRNLAIADAETSKESEFSLGNHCGKTM